MRQTLLIGVLATTGRTAELSRQEGTYAAATDPGAASAPRPLPLGGGGHSHTGVPRPAWQQVVALLARCSSVRLGTRAYAATVLGHVANRRVPQYLWFHLYFAL
jgi:hypothetical protein